MRVEPGALIWTVLFPFLGAAFLGVCSLGRWRHFERWAGWIASAAIGLSFFAILPKALTYISVPGTPPLIAGLFPWIDLGDTMLDARLYLDTLSAVMCLVVAGVSLLIHIYSIGYMAHEGGKTRYFAYLNLFCGFMLVLVTGSSLPVLFVGWEGVGLCSYLLIGFWFTDGEKAAAGKKAFVVNRIGDAGLLLGIFLAYAVFRSFEFQTILKWAPAVAGTDRTVLEILALLFFAGCVGKSAQFPLYIWLPDAMAGPTPVSALIHAATMVTSGVYLLARLAGLYALTPVAAQVVASVGALTAFLAATMAIAQNDIKKVLAFSTVSQLGYMALGVGVGAAWAGMWHLVTHAFFKALLFLGAGSIIHAMHGEQNILKMGGLKNYTVATTVTFFAGLIAILGVPGTSGWFSKDAILYAAWENGHPVILWVGVGTAILTTVYMVRLFSLTFLGIPKSPKHQLQDIHESPNVMLWPMWILAFFSLFAGFMPFDSALQAHFGARSAGETHLPFSEGQFSWILGAAVIVAAVLTLKAYRAAPAWLGKVSTLPVKDLLARQYGIDGFLTSAGSWVSETLATVSRLFDELVIDRIVNGLAARFEGASSAFSRLQSGVVQSYAFALLIGFAATAWYLVAVLK